MLARAGLGSRRQIEDWIAAGRITVDGRTATPGQPISGEELIRIDGHRVQLGNARRRVLAYYKPEGVVCSRRDPDGQPTLFADLPRLGTGRWIAVGRLDVNSQGLLLVTTDGELANRLMHPSSGIEREYAVRVRGQVAPEALEKLTGGVELDDGPARFDQVIDAGGQGVNHWYHVVLREGRKREVRRLWESQGLTVSRLVRVRYGPVVLRRGLKPGRWDELDDRAIAELMTAVGMAPPEPARPGPGPRRDTRRSRRR